MYDVIQKLLSDKELLAKMLSAQLAAYEGAPAEKLSTYYIDTLYYMITGGIAAAHHIHDEKESYIDFSSIKGGNGLLPKKLAESLGSKLHTGTALKAISKNEDGYYILTFQGNLIVVAEILVLAIPCSAFNDISFAEDIIPKNKLEAIKKVAYGTNGRILVPFDPMLQDRGLFISDDLVTFPNHDGKVVNLHLIGDAGKFSAATMSQTFLKEQKFLEIAFGRNAIRWINAQFARDELFASYEGPVGYSWPNDPFIKGSYAYIAPGQEAIFTNMQSYDGEMSKTLFAPIDHTLYFAGEHTSILTAIPGTMEAACESGERIAGIISSL